DRVSKSVWSARRPLLHLQETSRRQRSRARDQEAHPREPRRPFSSYRMPRTDQKVGLISRSRRAPSLQLDWVEAVSPEIESHLLPIERAILKALRTYSLEENR